MEGLSWDTFRRQAEASICKNCECGGRRPWRGNSSCIQSWLRFHSTRGIVITCSASQPGSRPARIEDGLMSECVPEHLVSNQ